MKGADVVMAGIVQYNDWLEEEVDFLHFHWGNNSDSNATVNNSQINRLCNLRNPDVVLVF